MKPVRPFMKSIGGLLVVGGVIMILTKPEIPTGFVIGGTSNALPVLGGVLMLIGGLFLYVLAARQDRIDEMLEHEK